MKKSIKIDSIPKHGLTLLSQPNNHHPPAPLDKFRHPPSPLVTEVHCFQAVERMVSAHRIVGTNLNIRGCLKDTWRSIPSQSNAAAKMVDVESKLAYRMKAKRMSDDNRRAEKYKLRER
jgi:hypothetical protein